MKLTEKIYIAGHSGLVGSAIYRKLKAEGFVNLITRTHKELDLTDQAQTRFFFNKEKPKYVILAAAKVGGIHANNTYPANFIYENLMVEANVIHSAYQNNTKRLLFLGSSCIYPKSIDQPMKETTLLTGVLEPTNEPYAISKIAGIKLCESYNRQYNKDFRSVMPTNLYGPNDNFHLENSHVIPALIRRIHTAKKNNIDQVVIWGSGNAMREFLYVEDMADASMCILKLDKKIYQEKTEDMLSHINIGSGEDISIRNLAFMISEIIGYKGKLSFDLTRPDGPARKLMDVSRLSSMGWNYKVDLKTGLEKTYKWYVENK
jgi:GDP-L-fucose synthase